MAAIDERIEKFLTQAGDKPPDASAAPTKKAYSEKISGAVALAVAAELRRRGLTGVRPGTSGESGSYGVERRMAGGIGAKKVDVTWATEEAGLLLAVSIKTINFRDGRTGNFQKNLANRRGDMLFEAVTLHRRFPYAVLGGLFFLDRGARQDGTPRRRSTFLNAHDRLGLFSGRNDPHGRDEQYERLYIALLEASSSHAVVDLYPVGRPEERIGLGRALDDLVSDVAIRNPDFYRYENGKLTTVSS